MYDKNSIGPKLDPFGTVAIIQTQSDVVPSSTTL